jgi:O-antigen/teichoic acid export membrane protein
MDGAGAFQARDRERTRKTVLWGVSLAFTTRVGTILLSFVLARLVAPEAFGQYAAVNGVVLMALAFSMQKFTDHLFFREDSTSAEHSSHMAFGVVLHLGLWVIVNLVAFSFELQPKLAKIALPLHMDSLAILLNVPRIYYSTQLRRALDWRKLRMLQIASFGLYAVVSITLALLGGGVFALITQDLLVPLPFIVAFLMERGPGLRFDWKAFRPAFRFGLLRTMSVGLGTAQQMCESLAFSLTLGYGALGLNLRARGFSTLATGWISDQVSGVLYPVMARLPAADSAGRRATGMLLKVGLWTSAPIAATAMMAPSAVILLLYGPKWGMAAPLLRPALAAGVALAFLAVASLTLLTNAGPRRPLALDASMLIANVAGLAFALPFGLHAYVLYLACANSVLVAVVAVLLIRWQFLDADDALRAATPFVLLACAAMAVSSQPVFIQAEAQAPFWTVLACAVGCSVVGAALTRLVDPKGLATLCGLVPGGHWLGRVFWLRQA